MEQSTLINIHDKFWQVALPPREHACVYAQEKRLSAHTDVEIISCCTAAELLLPPLRATLGEFEIFPS